MRLTTTRSAIEKLIPAYCQGNVLDVGAGSAKYKAFIARHAEAYQTCDIDPDKGTDFVEDASAMSFGDGAFDTVLSFQMLEHVEAPARVVRELKRVVRPGGHVIVTAPFLIPEHGDPSDYTRFTENGIATLFRAEGLSVVETGKYGGLWATIAELVHFAMLDPYRRDHGKLKSFLIITLIRGLLWLDARFEAGRVYANVYVVATKP